jgi:lipid-A-disaccharide synthase
MREVVPELIQEDLTAANITTKVLELIQPDRRAAMRTDYQTIRESLGDFGVCDRAATAILGMLNVEC